MSKRYAPPGEFLTDEEERLVRADKTHATQKGVLEADARRAVGERGEDLACRFLWRRGFRLLERNYRGARGEIDIVAEKKGRLHVVEVKTRTSESLGPPEERVNAKKRSALRRTAQEYLARFRDAPPGGVQFDVFSQVLDDRGRPAKQNLIENAF